MITLPGVLMICAWKQTGIGRTVKPYGPMLSPALREPCRPLQSGEDFVEQGRLDEAIRQYREALQIKPDDAQA